MPRNFKEAMAFTALMCTMMVLGMSSWNLAIANQFSLSKVLTGFIPGFLVAFALDVLLIGPLAKKVAFALLAKLPHHEKRWIKVVTISSCMVLGMVSLMSIYGLVMSKVVGQGLGWAALTVSAYGQTWLTNFVAALPYNLLVVGPIARLILVKFQKPFPGEDHVETFEDDEALPEII